MTTLCAFGVASSIAAAPRVLRTVLDFREGGIAQTAVFTGGVTGRDHPDHANGKGALEVTVAPFAEHGNRWPIVRFGPNILGGRGDFGNASTLCLVVENVSEGLSTIHVNMTSDPYNDHGRNVEGEGFAIPGGTIMECRLSTFMFRKSNNDPSKIQVMDIFFPPRATTCRYRIHEIRLEHDPSVGSPAEALAADAAEAGEQLASLDRLVDWDAIPKASREALRAEIPGMTRTVQGVLTTAREGVAQGLDGRWRANRTTLDTLLAGLGRFLLASKGEFFVWERSPYTYPLRDEMPRLDAKECTEISLRIAGNEYQTAAFMVSAGDHDVSLDIAVHAGNDGLSAAIDLRSGMFFKAINQQEYADPLEPLIGPLMVPAGESRDVWLRVDNRSRDIPAGTYRFSIELRSPLGGASHSIAGTLTVHPFRLPSYDSLRNNSYAQFVNSEIGGPMLEEGVRHMKPYGVNTVSLHYTQIPTEGTLTPDGQHIKDLDLSRTKAFASRVEKAWNDAPGKDTLHWVVFTSGLPQKLFATNGAPEFLSPRWEVLYGEWLKRLGTALGECGIGHERWHLVLADESSEAQLAAYEIPLAEAAKRQCPKVRISCNTSIQINDPELTRKLFALMDTFQPCLDAIAWNPALLPWLKTSGKPLWTYRCAGQAGTDKNLYDYYRVSPWKGFDHGLVGTGVWTYSSQGISPWSKDKRATNYNLVYKHPTKNIIVHSRRYEFFREGADDVRYLTALRQAAARHGDNTLAAAEKLASDAVADVISHAGDSRVAARWRQIVAERIIDLQSVANAP